MKKFLCCRKNKCQAEGSVVDGKLILSFPNATDPVLWQMDLVSAKASALEVVTDKESGYFALILKTPKGEAVEITKFDLREDAVQGLMVASHALRNAHGKIRSATVAGEQNNVTSYAHKERHPWKWARIILGVVIVLFLVFIFASISSMPPSNGSEQTVSSSGKPAGYVLGEPVSADAFLEGL